MTRFRYADVPRDVVLVQGDDALEFLHSQLANDIRAIEVGGSLYSLILDPTGHLCVIARVVRHVDTVFTLDVEPGFGEAVITRLKRYVLRSKVTMRMSDWVCRSFHGVDASHEIVTRHGVAVGWWNSHDVVDIIGPGDDMPSIGEKMSIEDYEARRISVAWPRLGVDIEVGDIPAATGLVPFAVSFTKGCYPGQELVERMDSRGASAPTEVRRLVGDFTVGDDVFGGCDVVGVVTSATRGHALARVKRDSQAGHPLRGE